MLSTLIHALQLNGRRTIHIHFTKFPQRCAFALSSRPFTKMIHVACDHFPVTMKTIIIHFHYKGGGIIKPVRNSAGDIHIAAVGAGEFSG